MHFSIDRTVHTTAFDKPVVDHWLERKIAQTAAGSTEKDRSDDRPLQRRARYRLSYIPLQVVSEHARHSGVGTILQWYRFFRTAITWWINLYIIVRSQLSINPEWMVFQIYSQIILSPNTVSHLALHNTSVFVFVSIAVYKSFVVAFCTSTKILSFCNRKMVSISPSYGSSFFKVRSHYRGKLSLIWL